MFIYLRDEIISLVGFYLAFLFALFFPGVMSFFQRKKKAPKDVTRDVLSKIVLFAFFGYIAQAFFNISVIQVAPYFWMICGFLHGEISNEEGI